MKKTIPIASGIVALIFLLCLSGIRFLGGAYLAGKITDEASGLNCKLQFADTPQIALFPPAIIFGRATVEADNLTFSFQKARIEPEILPLFQGRLNIAAAIIDKPSLTGNIPLERSAAENGAVQKQSPAPGLEIGRLAAHDGSVDLVVGDNAISLKDIKISAENLRPRRDADIKCDFSIAAGTEGNAGSIVGNFAFKGKIHYYAPNLTFRQAAASFTALGHNPGHAISPIQLGFDGALNIEDLAFRVIEAQFSTPAGKLKIRGDGGSNPPSFKGDADLEFYLSRLRGFEDYFGPEESAYVSSPIHYAGGKINLSALAVRICGAQGDGHIAISMPQPGKAAAITGDLKLGRLLFSSRDANEAQSPSSGLKPLSGEVGDVYPDLDLRLNIGGIARGNLQIGNILLELSGKNGSYQANPLNFEWRGGKIGGVFDIRLPENAWKLQSKGTDINFGALLKEGGIDGIEGGKGAFALDLAGEGDTRENQLKSITGSGSLEVTGARLTIMEYLSEIFNLFGKKNVNESGVNMKAAFKAASGVIDFAPITAKSRDVSANGSLALNLATSRVDSRIILKIGGLDVPLTFRGPLGDVQMGVDTDFNDY